MNNIIILNETISLPFNLIGKDINTHIINLLHKKLVGKFYNNNKRYIHEITDVKIGENQISTTKHSVIFKNIQTFVRTTNIEIGNIIFAEVTNIYHEGIFLEIPPIIKIIIPKKELYNTMCYDDSSQSFKGKNGKIIKIGDILQVKLDNVKFENNIYFSIAKLLS